MNASKPRQLTFTQKYQTLNWLRENAAWKDMKLEKVAQKAAADLGFDISPSTISTCRRAIWPEDYQHKYPKKAQNGGLLMQQISKLSDRVDRIEARLGLQELKEKLF